MIFNTPLFFAFFMVFLLFYGFVFLQRRPRVYFIRIVKNFQAISDRVEVLKLPKNSDWIHNTPQADARMAAITPEMFVDTTHLARYTGGVGYTRQLVETLAPQPETAAAE